MSGLEPSRARATLRCSSRSIPRQLPQKPPPHKHSWRLWSKVDLVALLRNPSTASPFPPLLFTSSASSLLAETYVSSHPLSGLCLHSPLAAPHAHKRLPAVFPTPLGEFNYEPLFPIAVVQPPGGEQPCRLLEEFGEEDEDALVQRIVAGRDEEGWQKVMDWMDENGL
ncbi:SPOSA6832_02012 [Sporobolomyces salmonicolor]|uniref:SPOSA6832_02012-mRNA-1:cds n=1 Tax=Sporidiobolus salmonicolor TaxID=5005 RepID=A0A0D6EKE5_SPOSA|nr:SPOSA6832_02012 [Sporobolomyces salmonicolor]